jgi:hypothetical protein
MDGNHLEKPYEKQIFHKIWLVTRTTGDTSLRPKEHRDLANDNRVHPLYSILHNWRELKGCNRSTPCLQLPLRGLNLCFKSRPSSGLLSSYFLVFWGKLYDQSFTRYLNVYDDYRPRPVAVAPEPVKQDLIDNEILESVPKTMKVVLDFFPSVSWCFWGVRSKRGWTMLSFARSRCSFGLSDSYGGLSKFEPKGYTKKQVREWLQSQDTYTLHKPTRRRFPRRRVAVYNLCFKSRPSSGLLSFCFLVFLGSTV